MRKPTSLALVVLCIVLIPLQGKRAKVDYYKMLIDKLEEELYSVNVGLPGYEYCMLNNDFLNQISDFKDHFPKNDLDRACFSHDLFYSTNPDAKPAEVRAQDIKFLGEIDTVMKSARASTKLTFSQKAKLELSDKVIVGAMKAKMLMEDMGWMDSTEFLEKNKEVAAKTAEIAKVIMAQYNVAS